MKFRLSDETIWTSEFKAADPDALARGIAAAWDVRIEATRRHPGATHPAFALAARLAEIDRWESERMARTGVTEEARTSWARQAWHWRYCARRDMGGDERSSPLHLHVWAPGELAPTALSAWSVPCARGRSGWRCDPYAPRVARSVSAERAEFLWDGSVAICEHTRNISALSDHVGELVRSALHPRPTLVK